ncbi:putative 26S protease regulatory subunit 8 [Monocercomonoides exilis]|uniref:putative 26S protease regulatory subunit 8 n=1 Tax=Monocercomonoides exilis TaxID=2049356 RepID=UPI003559E389|nr:putative 26S protease regulatory subunit 8 [Monocercomonoides exilis]|eukprot:MONOS_1299.1-p1 / transcript=MONOS_1299.1 / gene=MONOS_1299 / organism=Monocercomonoides_exilis_PA203 / gene_product=26S protease regulatory subunit 8 homolog A / transcript_product=26S protease regulatory subunit 8 homolog A / location=Mono_scaffold00022:97063-98776(+) / protein_length=391 / sequence_SO=supercontig / SO=protein_coding / is_pseudo=false
MTSASRILQHKYDNLIVENHSLEQELSRLEAKVGQLNLQIRSLRDEIFYLSETPSYVGEVIKLLGNHKCLAKSQPEGKFIVDIESGVDESELVPGTRVALRSDSFVLHRILPNKVDPLVSLMKVEKVPDSSYDQIGGLDKQIVEIKEVIELPIKHPELFESLGIAQPKGVLLYGPPGTGKTLLARAVAHHTNCTFIRVSGSELVQKYIGEGARMVRELFVMAREHSPSIIFMDEIDSIGGTRVESEKGGDSEVQRTMLELLNQLDGFEPSQNIKVLMATNRIDILDDALLRPGRIDRKIEFPNPNAAARLDILKIHSKRMNLMKNVNLPKIAEMMVGASGAEMKAVCTEAGMFALRERRVHVTQDDFELAAVRVMKKDGENNMSISKLWK